ncbi:MAG: hypothetical protein IJB51_13095 [Clostridia bacterium]|nr:hypothetical protein [Clostridia bacterium]
MNPMGNNECFQYTYSAKEQEEIRSIRKKYAAPEEEDKMARLRRLDGAATQKATMLALIFGVVGALVMGSGMSLAMTEIGVLLGLPQNLGMLIGIPVGLVGIGLVSAAYPVYNRTLKRERKKLAPEIIRLTDELLK